MFPEFFIDPGIHKEVCKVIDVERIHYKDWGLNFHQNDESDWQITENCHKEKGKSNLGRFHVRDVCSAEKERKICTVYSFIENMYAPIICTFKYVHLQYTVHVHVHVCVIGSFIIIPFTNIFNISNLASNSSFTRVYFQIPSNQKNFNAAIENSFLIPTYGYTQALYFLKRFLRVCRMHSESAGVVRIAELYQSFLLTLRRRKYENSSFTG